MAYGCIVCGAPCFAATEGAITCFNGHRVSLNPDIPSSDGVRPEHYAELFRRLEAFAQEDQ